MDDDDNYDSGDNDDNDDNIDDGDKLYMMMINLFLWSIRKMYLKVYNTIKIQNVQCQTRFISPMQFDINWY